MIFFKRIKKLFAPKQKYTDDVLAKYWMLREDKNEIEIIICCLSEIIKNNKYIHNKMVIGTYSREWDGDDVSDKERVQRIMDCKYNIYKFINYFELAINDYFNTKSIVVEYNIRFGGSVHVYNPLGKSISKNSPEYLVLEDKIGDCLFDNGVFNDFVYHPNLFDLVV